MEEAGRREGRRGEEENVRSRPAIGSTTTIYRAGGHVQYNVVDNAQRTLLRASDFFLRSE